MDLFLLRHKLTQHVSLAAHAPLSVSRARANARTTTRTRRRSTQSVVASAKNARRRSEVVDVSHKSSIAAALSTTSVVFPALASTVDATTWSSATEGMATNPALLGFTCVAACWVIPQTIGTAILTEKEKKGRELLKDADVDASYIPNGNWGKIQKLLRDNEIDYRAKK